MSSSEASGGEPGSSVETADAPVDPRREALVAELRDALGDHLLAVHLDPGRDLWTRVSTESWASTARLLADHGFDYFCFLSAIDWMNSPFGRSLDSEADRITEGAGLPGTLEMVTHGYTGGETRFQVFARLFSIRRRLGFTVKADVPDDTLAIGSWSPVYAGANWHERETYEMFGLQFVGHPGLRKLYLPTDFEGYPLRKDYPLLSRMVRPWPGIVDVEPRPGAAGDEGGE